MSYREVIKLANRFLKYSQKYSFDMLEFKKTDSEVAATIKFPNGYGASVVRGEGTYGSDEGLYELAVLNSEGNLDYSTPITSDVLGWLSEEDVSKYLNDIAALDSTNPTKDKIRELEKQKRLLEEEIEHLKKQLR